MAAKAVVRPRCSTPVRTAASKAAAAPVAKALAFKAPATKAAPTAASATPKTAAAPSTGIRSRAPCGESSSIEAFDRREGRVQPRKASPGIVARGSNSKPVGSNKEPAALSRPGSASRNRPQACTAAEQAAARQRRASLLPGAVHVLPVNVKAAPSCTTASRLKGQDSVMRPSCASPRPAQQLSAKSASARQLAATKPASVSATTQTSEPVDHAGTEVVAAADVVNECEPVVEGVSGCVDCEPESSAADETSLAECVEPASVDVVVPLIDSAVDDTVKPAPSDSKEASHEDELEELDTVGSPEQTIAIEVVAVVERRQAAVCPEEPTVAPSVAVDDLAKAVNDDVAAERTIQPESEAPHEPLEAETHQAASGASAESVASPDATSAVDSLSAVAQSSVEVPQTPLVASPSRELETPAKSLADSPAGESLADSPADVSAMTTSPAPVVASEVGSPAADSSVVEEATPQTPTSTSVASPKAEVEATPESPTSTSAASPKAPAELRAAAPKAGKGAGKGPPGKGKGKAPPLGKAPASSKADSSLVEGESFAGPRMKALHWTIAKVAGDSVWENVAPAAPLNISELTRRFAQQEAKTLVVGTPKSSTDTAAVDSRKRKRILDASVSQKLGIVFSRLPPPERLAVMLETLEGFPENLPSEAVLALNAAASEQRDAIDQLRKLNMPESDIMQLDVPERYLWVLGTVPHCVAKLSCGALIAGQAHESKDLCQTARVCITCCQSLRNSKLLRKYISTCLQIGNLMNRGTQRAGATAVVLPDAFLKLDEMRSAYEPEDGFCGAETRGPSLLDFVAQAIVEDEGEGGRDAWALRMAVEELQGKVKSASSVSIDDVQVNCKQLHEEAQQAAKGLPGLPPTSGSACISSKVQSLLEEASQALALVKEAKAEIKWTQEWSSAKANCKSEEWLTKWSSLLEQLARAFGRVQQGSAQSPFRRQSSAPSAPFSAPKGPAPAMVGGSLSAVRSAMHIEPSVAEAPQIYDDDARIGPRGLFSTVNGQQSMEESKPKVKVSLFPTANTTLIQSPLLTQYSDKENSR